MKILVSSPYLRLEIDRFRPEFEAKGAELILPEVSERLSEAELLGCIADVDGVICGDDQFTEAVLLRARRLKVISKWGTGIDSIDREACARLGIQVRNTPGAFTEPVADSVLGYLLCFARRAAAFGMTVLDNDLRGVPAGVRGLSLEELLEQSDFVSLNCDLNPTSRGLIDARALAMMKPSAYLVNTARGGVLDERALVQALQENRIAGAALDVFEQEPLPKDSPLRQMENVWLAPHNANSSPRAWQRVHRNSIDNVFAVLEGRA